MFKPPKIEDAPGLTWKRRKNGYEARWQARTDLVERGYEIKSHGIRLCFVKSEVLEPLEVAIIQEKCQSLQADMLAWAHGGVPQIERFDKTVQGLIDCYKHDPDSTFRKNRYRTREYYNALCRQLVATEYTDDAGNTRILGTATIAELKARLILRLHRTWIEGDKNKVAKAHSLVGMLRTICTFGKTILEDAECARLGSVLSDMKFPVPKPRTTTLTADQAQAVIAEANRQGWHSVALAQAIQFEGTLRQKDVIGEWIPIEDPGISDVTYGVKKWLRGLRWEEVNDDFVLTHVTSKRQKEITIDLKLAPMVMAQLGNQPRSAFPASGPVVIRDTTERPWDDEEFRKRWRKIATACGIPTNVRNMDSRAGAITEATQAGAELEHIKQAATHGDISMTQRYSREAESKIAGVMKLRVAHRNEKGK